MTLLYTLPKCPNCDEARLILAARSEEFREIPIDNHVTEVGVKALFGKMVAPFLIRDDGFVYFLVDPGDGQKMFAKIVTT